MSYEKAIVAVSLLDKHGEILSMHLEKQYLETLPILEDILQSEDLKLVEKETGARTRFLYQKAVALDMVGKSEESLEILLGLIQEYPGAPDFEHSLQIVCGSFEKRARDLVTNKPDDPLLSAFLSVLEQCGLPPYWLIQAVAAQEAGVGETEIAWGRMQALLDLSPNDEDYLRSALEIADHCGFGAKRSELLAHIRCLVESHPYRLDLVRLLCAQGGAEHSVTSGT